MKILRRHTRTRGRAARAFTVLEMVLVVTIIGMIATVVTVSWRAVLPFEELNAEVRRLSNTLQTARTEAIGRSAEYQVEYDLATNEYWILAPFDAEGAYEPDPEKRTKISRHTLHRDIDIDKVTIDDEDFSSDEKVFVRFDAVGSSSAHSIVLKQSGKTERWFTIEVLPLTGQIRFHDGVYEREEAEDADFE